VRDSHGLATVATPRSRVDTALGSNSNDLQLVDEIAARVWYAVIRDGGRVLAGFDPQRDTRLRVFLTGVARLEARQYLRTDGDETLLAMKPG